MAYIGLQPVENFLITFSEQFNGDGSTKQFILTRSVSRAEDLEVFVGSTQILPAAFTATGNELTFVNAPGAGTNNITVIYRAGALQSISSSSNGLPAGTAASPSVYLISGTNTGIYWPSTTTLGFSLAGTSRVIFSSLFNSTSTTTGAVQVAGGAGITGNVYAGGLVRFTDVTESSSAGTGALTIAGGLGVAKNINVGGDIQVSGDFTVAGTFNTTNTNTLEVNDPLILLATTNTGDSLDIGFAGKYNKGSGDVDRYAGMYRDSTAGTDLFRLFANLTVEPSSTVSGSDPSFRYAGLIGRSLTASETLISTGGAASTSTTTGALQITGGAGITGNVYAGALYLGSGLISTTGAIGNVASLSSSGAIATTGLIFANSNIASSSTTTGALIVNGGLGASGNINASFLRAVNAVEVAQVVSSGTVNASGIIFANSATASGSTSTGALVIPSGGLGVSGAVNAGGAISAGTSLTAGTTLSAAGTLNVQTAAGQLNYNPATAALGLYGTDSEIIMQGITNEPASPSAGNLVIYSKSVGGRLVPKWKGPSGLDTPIQASIAQNKIGWWSPPGAGVGSTATTVPAVVGLNAMVALGTATARPVAATNLFTRMRRLGYVSGATGGANAGIHTNADNLAFTIGDGSGLGGFYFIARFGASDGVIQSGARVFCGMSNLTTAPAAGDPSGLTNQIGVGANAADTNLRIMYGGSAAQTPIDLGASFPKSTASNTNMYELVLFAPTNSNNTVYYRVTNLSTNVETSGTLTGTAGTALPASTTFLGPRIYRQTSVATAVAIDIVSLYIETDY